MVKVSVTFWHINKEALDVDGTEDNSKIMALINGLATKTDFLHHLAQNSPETYANLIVEAQKIIVAEEIFKAREATGMTQGGRSERKAREPL